MKNDAAPIGAAVLASAIAQGLDTNTLTTLAAFLVSLADNLALIAATRQK